MSQKDEIAKVSVQYSGFCFILLHKDMPSPQVYDMHAVRRNT